jgi:hypothetical protein
VHGRGSYGAAAPSAVRQAGRAPSGVARHRGGRGRTIVRASHGVRRRPAGVVFGGSITYEPTAVEPSLGESAIPTTPPTATATLPTGNDDASGLAGVALVAAFAIASIAVLAVQPRRRVVRGSHESSGQRRDG